MASPTKSHEVGNKTDVNQGDGNATLQPPAKPNKLVLTNKCTLFFRRHFSKIVLIACVITLGLFGGFGYLISTVKPIVPKSKKMSLTKLYEDVDAMDAMDTRLSSTTLFSSHPIESYGARLRSNDKKRVVMTVPCITTKWYASDFLSKHTTKTMQMNKSTMKHPKPKMYKLKIKHMKKRQSGRNRTEMENDSLFSERNTTTFIRNKVQELPMLTEYTFAAPNIRSDQVLKLSQDKEYNPPDNEIVKNVTEIIKGLVEDIFFDSVNENITSHKNYYEINRDEGPTDKIITQIMQKLALFSRVLNITRYKFDMVLKENNDLLSNLIKDQSLKYKALEMTDIASTTADESDRLRNEIIKIRMMKMLNYTKSPRANQSENTRGGQTQSITNKSNHTDNDMTITSQKPVLVKNANRSEESKFDEINKKYTKLNETVQITSKTAKLINKTYYRKKKKEMSTVTKVSQRSSDHVILHPHKDVNFLGQSGQSKSYFKLNIGNRIENYKNPNKIKQLYTKSRKKNPFVKFIVREKSHL